MRLPRPGPLLLAVLLLFSVGCAKTRAYQDKNMDFGSIKTVVVMPLWNLTQNQQAADRVRDVFANALLATNAVYVVPTGEVARAVSRLGRGPHVVGGIQRRLGEPPDARDRRREGDLVGRLDEGRGDLGRPPPRHRRRRAHEPGHRAGRG